MDAPSVPANIFTGTPQVILCFTNIQVRVLVDDGYDIQEVVICCKFTYIKEWFQLKSKITLSRGGVSYIDRNIKCLQALAWWVKDLKIRGKLIYLKHFKTDIRADAIE